MLAKIREVERECIHNKNVLDTNFFDLTEQEIAERNENVKKKAKYWKIFEPLVK
jgi:hypothetical protein